MDTQGRGYIVALMLAVLVIVILLFALIGLFSLLSPFQALCALLFALCWALITILIVKG